jgi:hypothetical protein
MPQPVVHFEIVGGDAAALHTFYAQLFGWKIEPRGPGGYGLVQPPGTNIELGRFTDPEDHVIGLTTTITSDQPHTRRAS